MDNKIIGQTASDSFFNNLSLEMQLKFVFSIEFADCLVRRRKELGWTQDKLAEESGINRVTIAKLETYQRMASIETMLKLLHTLGMKVQFIESEIKENQ